MTKKVISLILITLMVMNLCAFTVDATTEYEVCDFEYASKLDTQLTSGDEGITYYGGGIYGYIASSVEGANGNCLKFQASGDNLGIKKDFENTYTGTTTLSFRLKAIGTSAKATDVRFILKDSTDAQLLQIALTPGATAGKTGIKNITTAKSARANNADLYDGEWHQFDLQLSNAGTFTIKVDGVNCEGIVGHETFYNLDSTNALAGICFGMGYGNSGNFVCVDDIIVSNTSGTMPGVVVTDVDGASLTLSAADSSIIKYAIGSTAAEARQNFSSNALEYTSPIQLIDQVYVAARSENSYGVSAIKVFTLAPKVYEICDFEDATKLDTQLTSGDEGITYYGGGVFGYIASSVEGANGNCLKFQASGENLGVKKDFENTYPGTTTLSFRLKAIGASAKATDVRFILKDSTDAQLLQIALVPGSTAGKTGIRNANTGKLARANNADLYDGEWHQFDLQLSNAGTFTIKVDGVNCERIAGHETFYNLDSTNALAGICFGMGFANTGNTVCIDDIAVSSVYVTIPSIVEMEKTDSLVTLSANVGNSIEYSISNSQTNALNLLGSNATNYTAPIELNGLNQYIAARAISEDGTKGSIKVFGPLSAAGLIELDKYYHLSPWSVVAAGGVQDDDSLQLGVENNKISVTQTAVADAGDVDDPGESISGANSEYVDITFNGDYNGGRQIKDMTLVFEGVGYKAAYNFAIMYKTPSDDEWQTFYSDVLDDTNTYNQDNLPIYPTVKLTGFDDKLSDIVAIRVMLNLNGNGNPTVLKELDLNMVNDGFDNEREEKNAQLKFARIFADNMILQRDEKIKIWGYGGYLSDDAITVSIKNAKGAIVRTGNAVLDNATQTWSVELDGIEGGLNAYTITAVSSATEESINISNVLFGDVYVASGQSNMELSLSYVVSKLLKLGENTSGWNEGKRILDEIEKNKNENIRFFRQSTRFSAVSELRDSYTGSWKKANSYSNIDNVSAVAYFFAEELYEQLGKEIPVGVMCACVGSTSIGAWVPRTNPEITDTQVSNISLSTLQSGFYNSLIVPLTSVKAKGVIWYQGEADSNRTDYYKEMYNVLQTSWREKWGCDLSFTATQLSSYDSGINWPEMREAQLHLYLNDPTGGLAVTTDVGGGSDIHPLYKAPVGKRLALSVAAKDYKKDIEYSGPLFDSITKNGNSLTIKFTHADGMDALERAENYTENFEEAESVTGFEISANGSDWFEANAQISGDTVTVSAEGISDPMYVRYAWANNVTANLYNSDLLPAVPFKAGFVGTQAAPVIGVKDDVVTISGNVINAEKLYGSYKLIISKFNNDGTLATVEIKDINTVVGENTPFEFETDDFDNVEVFVWNDLETLIPITETVQK